MAELVYQPIVQHYERCLAEHQNGHLAVDWPNELDLRKRFRVMTDLANGATGRLLDFGCGVGLYYEYLARAHPDLAALYCGLDISRDFVDVFMKHHPDVQVICSDVLRAPLAEPFDYVVMNGVLTIKQSLTWREMWMYTQRLLSRVFEHVEVGLAFNVMADWVQWSRMDLFHLPLGVLIPWVRTHLSPHFQIRADYGLYEYTLYVYRRPPVFE